MAVGATITGRSCPSVAIGTFYGRSTPSCTVGALQTGRSTPECTVYSLDYLRAIGVVA